MNNTENGTLSVTLGSVCDTWPYKVKKYKKINKFDSHDLKELRFMVKVIVYMSP